MLFMQTVVGYLQSRGALYESHTVTFAGKVRDFWLTLETDTHSIRLDYAEDYVVASVVTQEGGFVGLYKLTTLAHVDWLLLHAGVKLRPRCKPDVLDVFHADRLGVAR
uniref:Uncharacterized protein n=1 Tax=uncultured Caudovirales phage TaxID=2100421 RepID=A0A6J5L1X8_9CAUD|nr:hypothetical protein UFOVP114_23 [uncultured Caudovirales phage]